MPVLPSAPSSLPESQYATRDYVMEWYSRLSARIDEITVSGMTPATTSTLGGVIVGGGLTVGSDGRIDVVFPSHVDYLTKTDASSTYATKQELAGLELTGDYVPLTQDRNGDLSAATVGGRSTDGSDKVGVCSFSSGRGNIASGDHSHAEGDSVIANGLNSHAEGCTTKAKGNCSHAEGKFTEASGAYSHAAGFRAKAQQRAYAWSGVDSDEVYESNGDGTYNINPANGIKGFFVGQKNLKTIISEFAAPGFNQLVPETSEDKVTLKPVDGAANWVDGKVEVGSARPVITSVDVNIGTVEAVFEFFEPETGEIISTFIDANNIHIECALEDYNENSPSEVEHFGYWNLRTTSEVVCANPSGTPICTIPSGITFTAAAVSSEKIDGENVFNEHIRLFDLFDFYDKIIWHTSEGEQLVHNAFYDMALIQNATVSASRSSKICLPTSTDTTKARKFTLAVETDVDAEKAVEWQGGEVIEAVPGASKLVPGLTMWDVAEVAPGKFKVERASSPAQSAPLTLTAPNGRVAELTVGDDLVLEVKEV